jgi:hypothetical protein
MASEVKEEFVPFDPFVGDPEELPPDPPDPTVTV